MHASLAASPLPPLDVERGASLRPFNTFGLPCTVHTLVRVRSESDLRRVVTGALELERAEKRIGSSLQAAPHVHVAPEYVSALKGLDLREICIVSGGDLVEGPVPAGAFTLPDVPGVGVVSALASGNKCARCWQVLEEVGKSAKHPLICQRCEEAVA